MQIDPAKTVFYVPPGLRKFKQDLFDRIAGHIQNLGGRVIRQDVEALAKVPTDITPIVGCMPECTPLIAEWRAKKRQFVYQDRGYARRVFATWLPRGENGGFYRWTINGFQIQSIRPVPDDRWKALNIEVHPWRRSGRHIVIAAPTRTYARFHQCEGWLADTLDAISRVTDRQLVIRDKESKRSLQSDLHGAHALVTHGSIAAVEAAILGYPVFVHPDSAAALVGRTDLKKIESPVYPDRQPWLNALAYSQFNESELVDGTLWRLLN